MDTAWRQPLRAVQEPVSTLITTDPEVTSELAVERPNRGALRFPATLANEGAYLLEFGRVLSASQTAAVHCIPLLNRQRVRLPAPNKLVELSQLAHSTILQLRPIDDSHSLNKA